MQHKLSESDFQEAILVRQLSCHTRQEWEAGRKAVIDLSTWADIATRHLDTSVRTNQERLLLYVKRKTGRPGRYAKLNLDRDYTLIDCDGPEAFFWYLKTLQARRLIVGVPGEVSDKEHPDKELEVELTADGWEFLDPLERDQIEPGRVFVAMSFNEPRELEDAITGAIKAVGGHAEVVRNPKDGERNQEITERIRSEIVRAEVVVADCSGHRPNVYFEIGYAMGLGRHVVLTCRQEDWDREQHFDTHHYPHLLWKDCEELRKELPDWLRPRLAQKAPGSGS